MTKHKCSNEFRGEGAGGGCFVEIADIGGPHPHVSVGWSCVFVHDKPMPITWLAEIITIATSHAGGVAGFLQHHNYAGGYALLCDPPGDAA